MWVAVHTLPYIDLILPTLRTKNFTLGKKLCERKPGTWPTEASYTMTTIDIIKECILALNDRTGSSVQAMTKWIQSEKQVSFVCREIPEAQSGCQLLIVRTPAVEAKFCSTSRRWSEAKTASIGALSERYW